MCLLKTQQPIASTSQKFEDPATRRSTAQQEYNANNRVALECQCVLWMFKILVMLTSLGDREEGGFTGYELR